MPAAARILLLLKNENVRKAIGAVLVSLLLIITAAGTSCTAHNLLIYSEDVLPDQFGPYVEAANRKIEGTKIDSRLLHAVYITLFDHHPETAEKLTKCFYRVTTKTVTVTKEDGTKTEKEVTVYRAVTEAEQVFQRVERAFSLSISESQRVYMRELAVFLAGSYNYSNNITDYSPAQDGEPIVFTDGVTPVVYYNQMDSQWKNKPYGTDTIGGYACGPTSMAIVVSSLTDTRMDPVQMSQWSYENGYWAKGSGSYRSLIPGAAEAFGLSCQSCSKRGGQKIVNALASGKLVVAIMGPGHFTRDGHFIVLRGVTSSGKILVADCASTKRSGQEWDLNTILKEAGRDDVNGPFWIIGR